jgi:hypothetical protein
MFVEDVHYPVVEDLIVEEMLEYNFDELVDNFDKSF